MIDNSHPTSGDEMPPPGLASFLRTTKPKSAAKRAPSVSAAKRTGVAPPQTKRAQSASRSRSRGRRDEIVKGSGPIRPLSPAAIMPLPKPTSPPAKKKPQDMMFRDGDLSSKRSHTDRNDFLDQILSELSSSWPDDSMAWVNFHVSSYYYSCGGLTHPRQLAACSLHSNSNESHRWSCWACQLEPEGAQAAGFSPSKSIWRTDADQCYHWRQVHAKQSPCDWLRQAEEHCITLPELCSQMLGCDISETAKCP